MLYFSLFLAGFTLGVFAALRIFAPESQEEIWDPQHFPESSKANKSQDKTLAVNIRDKKMIRYSSSQMKISSE